MKRPLGIVLSLALSLLLTLAGCSGGETASALPQAAEGTLSLAPDQPVHLAVVAGEAANSPTHDYTGEVLSSLLTTLCRQGGHLTLVEADGAKRLPLKAPAEHEPVIPPCADAVAAVAGMDAVGQAVGAVCHRPERVCALLGAGAEHVLTPEDVALLLANPQGGRKGVGEAMAFRCVLNKADTPQRAAHASAVAGRLAERGIHSAITYYREEERGGLCWF